MDFTLLYYRFGTFSMKAKALATAAVRVKATATAVCKNIFNTYHCEQ